VLPLGYPCEIIGTLRPVNVTSCRVTPNCSEAATARYRTIDGTCNNIEKDFAWGSTGETFRRLVKRSKCIIYYNN
jgi:hypothetical protein